MIRKNMKLRIGLIIGIILPSVFVYAANSLSANSISIDKSKMSKVENSNLQSALDYLYGQSEKTNIITIESGVLHKSQTYLGIVYLDPTNLENKCTSANSVSETGTKTGCMKWYIYKDLGDSYKMILDHNTTAQQDWNTATNVTEHGTNVAFEENITGDSTKDNLAYIELMKLVSDYNWVLTPDLIEASEIANIVGYNGFTNTSGRFYLDSKNQTSTNTSQGTSSYAWLFDNLGLSDWGCTDYGCNVNNVTGANISAGYWTKTPYGEVGTASNVWYVTRSGALDRRNYASMVVEGLRPVVTVSKSLFQ